MSGKSRKQKRTTKQLHADLGTLGYDGSYNRVAAFARDWKAARQQEQKTCGRGVFVPLAFLAGEAFQFDWSEDWAIIGGGRTNCRSLTSSSPTAAPSFSAPILQQTHEMLFDAHNHAFRVLGGVRRRGTYDNMRTAVDKVGRGKERQVNARFSAMVSHFKLLSAHAGFPVGVIKSLRTVGQDLRIEAELNLELQSARDLHSIIKHSGGLNFSVGFPA